MARTWRNIQDDARLANGRGDLEIARQLFAQSVDAARDPALPWFDLQSALAGSALFHHHIAGDYETALEHYRESLQLLQDEIGPEAREAKNFAACLADCKRDASEL